MTAQTRMVKANGLDMQIVEQGKGPLVLLCHGWPELSYSWRHQIPAIAAAGFELESVTRASMRKALPFIRPTVRGVARLDPQRGV